MSTNLVRRPAGSQPMVIGVIVGLLVVSAGVALLTNFRGLMERMRVYILEAENSQPRWVRRGYRAANSPRVFYRALGAELTLCGLLLVGISLFGSPPSSVVGRLWVSVTAGLATLIVVALVFAVTIASWRGRHGDGQPRLHD